MLNNLIKNMDKIIYLVFFMLLTVFMLGAGQVTHELWQRNAQKKVENGRWSEILSEMANELPEQDKASWEKVSKKDSDKLIRATYILYSTE
jgi:cytochrome oxidase assembly protein ShyY1